MGAREQFQEWIEEQKRELDRQYRKTAPMILCGEPDKNDAPAIVRETYDLALEDHFDGPELIDPSKWNTSFLWGPGLTINNEEQYYVDVLNGDTSAPNPFSLSPEGNLLITAAPITGTKPVTNQGLSGGQNYSSGIITTRDSLCFTYGYVEVCAKVPCNVDGAWPAFWLLNCFYYRNAAEKIEREGLDPGTASDKFNPEIDFEWVSGNNNELECSNNSYHFYTGDRSDEDNYYLWTLDESDFRQRDANTGVQETQFNVYADCKGSNQFTLPPTCSADNCDEFHTFAFHWTPERLEYLIDGSVVNCIEHDPYDLVTDQAMYLLLNFAVGGSYPFGNPPSRLADPADYPASLEIEYARIYTRP